MRIDEIRDEIKAQMDMIKEPLLTSKAYPHPDWYLNAQLHVASEIWDTYAEGYKSAGDIIVKYVIKNKCYQDFLVYPIVFLYRQYLELRLKELIRVSSWLLGQDVKVSKTHNLLALWDRARPNIEKVWPDSEAKGVLITIGDRLRELSVIDPESEAFRYPESKKGKPTLVEVEHINLKHLMDVIQGISNVLDGASTGMGELLNARHEMMGENRVEADDEYRGD